MTIVPSPSSFGKRARTRDDLLAAAQALLLERRAGAIAIADIAARAGVSHGTFYNYFESFDALLDAIGELAAATHGLCVRSAVANAEGAAEIFAIKSRQTL
ncbi:MAG: TetR family transcriptional regulator, partial [Parvularculaceae bacterium]|nr:TetR family transcriptional regulator [Parvularculaceae bacterium]